MTQFLARYPVLSDARALSVVAAVVMAAAALLLGPDGALAGSNLCQGRIGIIGGRSC
jgi:hypothetical protein